MNSTRTLPRVTTLGVWAVLVFGFLYAPILTIGVFSFMENSSSSLPLQGFTWAWYEAALSNSEMLTALWNSVVVASGAVVIAISLGVPAAVLIHRYPFPGKDLFRRFVLLPLVLPGVITGVAFLTFYSALGIPLTLTGVMIAHGTALTSTVLTTCYARLLRLGGTVEEASMDLGASRWKTFWHTTVPQLRVAILASALLSFTLSFDEIPVTFFIIGTENTLPIYIYSALRKGFTPEINAVSTLVILVSVILIVISTRLTRETAAVAPGTVDVASTTSSKETP
ncbi:ABC transporter permease [Pseudarthrobacter sp. NKDBFgelt]|uniref:ABC transporter permease n=1 Tax=Pseudarthrobacter sp. NKDBFgelt TaxID=3384443 RepID=UPI0038D3CE95